MPLNKRNQTTHTHAYTHTIISTAAAGFPGTTWKKLVATWKASEGPGHSGYPPRFYRHSRAKFIDYRLRHAQTLH